LTLVEGRYNIKVNQPLSKMLFKNDPYHSKAYKHLLNLEAQYVGKCRAINKLPIIDNVFLPSGDIDIYKSIVEMNKLIKEVTK
tara:strand:+ start:118 stop:366 length:249 start_codon:yes stop_codon:yes gene_type:complete